MLIEIGRLKLSMIAMILMIFFLQELQLQQLQCKNSIQVDMLIVQNWTIVFIALNANQVHRFKMEDVVPMDSF